MEFDKELIESLLPNPEKALVSTSDKIRELLKAGSAIAKQKELDAAMQSGVIPTPQQLPQINTIPSDTVNVPLATDSPPIPGAKSTYSGNLFIFVAILLILLIIIVNWYYVKKHKNYEATKPLDGSAKPQITANDLMNSGNGKILLQVLASCAAVTLILYFLNLALIQLKKVVNTIQA